MDTGYFFKAEERGYFEELGTDGRIVSKLILQMSGGRLFTGFIRLRIGKGGRFLYIQKHISSVP
jgi:hypothetical protein